MDFNFDTATIHATNFVKFINSVHLYKHFEGKLAHKFLETNSDQRRLFLACKMFVNLFC